MTHLPRNLSAGCGCDDPSVSSGLIGLDEALHRIASAVKPIRRTEVIPLHRSRGRVLAAAVLAQTDMPRFNHAAMDGYAVSRKALTGDGPWLLPVTGRVAAGDAVVGRYEDSVACRIFTGAPVPHPFDGVVMQEKVERFGDVIRLKQRPSDGANVRRQGEEHRRGTEILPAGTLLTPRAIAACAAAGYGYVETRGQVRLTLLASGTEVVAPGAGDLPMCKIWDVNTPMFQSLLARPCVDLQDVIKVDDSQDRIREAIGTAATHSDLILTTGGVSVGDEDHLHAAVQAAGGRVYFARVAIKPGKPVALGAVGNAVWLGLPGNPGSAFVTWSVIGATVLNTLAGRTQTQPARRLVVLGHSLSRKIGRSEFRAARIVGLDEKGRDIVECPSKGNSGQVSGLADGDGLVFLPSDLDHLPQGGLIEFISFCSD